MVKKMQESEKIKKSAIDFVKKNKKELIEKFASQGVYSGYKNAFAFFMAGSPCAGKTEFSKRLIKTIQEISPKYSIVRIDPDEIKEEIPGYDGSNASLYQDASSLAAEKILDFVLKPSVSQNFILDGTFSNYKKAEDNIERALKRKRKVAIFYKYIDPVEAWELTKQRGELKGRFIPKDFFIKSFFSAIKTVDNIKKKFGKDVEVYLVEGDFLKDQERIKMNIDRIDHHFKIRYTEKSLREKI